MDQPTFADLEYGQKKRKTRREEFLEKLEILVPWQRLEERIRPRYFRGERGRRPYALAVMLRMHVVQLCYNLSDPALVIRGGVGAAFAGLRLTDALPDESTILHFRPAGAASVMRKRSSGRTGSAAGGESWTCVHQEPYR